MWDNLHTQNFKTNHNHWSFIAIGESVLTRGTRIRALSGTTKKKTSLRHKVRLQPQTKTTENTCSALSSGKEYQTLQNIQTSIYSTCTATPEYLVTQGKRQVGQTLTSFITTSIILFLLKRFKHSNQFLSTLNSTCWYHSLSLAPTSRNNITHICQILIQ